MIRMPLFTLVLMMAAGCAPAPEDDPREAVDTAATASTAQAAGSIDDAARAVREFHRALEEGDSTTALGLLHTDAIIYEGGHAETVPEYRGGHLPADIRFATATEREVISEQTVSLGSGAVLYLAETRVTGTVGEREIDSEGVETVVLSVDGPRWLIRHVHWSSR